MQCLHRQRLFTPVAHPFNHDFERTRTSTAHCPPQISSFNQAEYDAIARNQAVPSGGHHQPDLDSDGSSLGDMSDFSSVSEDGNGNGGGKSLAHQRSASFVVSIICCCIADCIPVRANVVTSMFPVLVSRRLQAAARTASSS